MNMLKITTAKGDNTMKKRTIKTNRLNKILRGATALILLGAISFLAPMPSVAIDLMHNSTDTGSTKWGGKWGVSGGRYGQFTCATCHEPNAKPNIKNVRAVISVMNPVSSHLLPNGLKSIPVSYRNVTSQGLDRDNHATSSRICEVCHSQTQYHRYNSSALVDKNHPPPKVGGTVCTSCHKHNTAFKGACGGCHGNPPRYATFGNDSGLVGKPRISNTLTPGQAGHHVTHTEARNMVCDTCHYINNGIVKMPNLSDSIDIGFFGFGGKVTSGTYKPYSGSNRGYKVASGTPNTTIASVSTNYASANICSNVYCHGGGSVANGKPPLSGGSNTAPRWDAPAQNQCGSCHGAVASAPPTTGAHVKHAGTAGYSLDCDYCHPAIDMAHVQGVVRWKFNPADPRTASAKYRPYGFANATSSGNTGDLAPSNNLAGECSNVRCHGDGRGGLGYVATPTWNGSLPANCIGCHGNTSSTSNPIVSKGHKAHVFNTSARFNNFDFKCYECHFTTVDATDMTVISKPLHANGTSDVAWGGPKTAGGLPYATNGCSQVYCHSNGQGIFRSPPTTWNAMADDQQGTIGCSYCHGGLAADGTAAVSSMRHTNHIGSGPLPHKPINCNWCHSNTVAVDGSSVYNSTNVKHINRAIDVSFVKLLNYSGSYDPGNKRCSATYCHATGTTSSRDWDTPTLNTCGNCHEANNSSTATTKLSDAHRKHYNTVTRPPNTGFSGWSSTNRSVNANVFMCGVCHWSAGGPVVSHVNGLPAGVTNGSVAEVALKLPFTPPVGAERAETVTRGTGVTLDGRGYGYSTGTTCDTYCHTDGRGGAPKTIMRWATTTTSCGNCHNKYGDTGTSVSWSGNHSKHLAGARSANASCNACHAATASDNTSLITGRRDRHPNGFRNVTGNSVTRNMRWNGATQQCTNTYCHFSNTMTWGGAPLPVGCTGCHGGLASSGSPMNTMGHKSHVNNDSAQYGGFFFSCADCHNTTTSTNDAISNPVNHANGVNNVAWGTRAGGTGTLAYNAGNSCTVYCHSNGLGVFRSQPKLWTAMTPADEGTISCNYCHNGLAAQGSAISSMRHTNHIGTGPLPHKAIGCNACHSMTVAADGSSVFNGTGVKHINRVVDVTFIKMGNFSGVFDAAHVCTNTYCHGNGSTAASRDWDTATVNTCGNCHEASNLTAGGLSAAHIKHYNTTTRPANTTTAGWDNTNLSGVANVYNCGVCHPANPTVTHLNGPPVGVTNGSVAEVVLRLPFTAPAGASRPESISRGTGVQYDGRGYGYSTGTSCNTYCHSDGRGNAAKVTMYWAATTSNCGNCHNKYGDSGSSITWSGNHSKHLTGARSTTASCNACHAATAADNTSLITGRRDRHPNGFRNVTGNSVTRALRWNGTTQQCSNTYCHFSNVMTWGGAPLPVGCIGCHGGLATSGSPMNTLGHKSHVNNTSAKYGGFVFTCADCHATTTSTNDAISNPVLHANGTTEVAWGAARAGGTGTLAYNRTASCTVYCHSNGAGVFRSQPKLWTAMLPSDEGTINCDYCHNGLATDSTAISSGRHTNHLGSGPLPHKPMQCNACHSMTVGTNGISLYNGPGTKHINRAIDVTFIKLANFSGSYTLGGTHVCSNTYCHGNNSTTSVRDWDTATINTCGNCHEANNTSTAASKLSDAHRKHYNSATRPANNTTAGWANTNLSATNNVFNCGVCHPANPTVTHLNGPPVGVTNGSVAEVVIRLPFTPPAGTTRPETFTRGTGVTLDGRGYGYSTGTTCNTYCHSDGRGGDPKTTMAWATSTSSCGNCHNKASDSPTSTTWSKAHDKHAITYGNGGTVGSYNNTTNNTDVTCAACHASTAATNTSFVTGSRAKHPDGFRSISASIRVGAAAFRWDAAQNQCKNGYCHSNALSFTDYSTPWIKWDVAVPVNCGSCHKTFNTAGAPVGPDYANGFKGKANSHSTHAVYWGFTCNYCHNATSSTGTSITNVRNHVNKGYNPAAATTVSFGGRSNTFTAVASTNPPVTKTTCSAVNCHGGNAAKVFTWGGTNKCGDCHLTTAADVVYYGFSKTPSTIANINSTEWKYSGHGKSSGTYDVTGAPFAAFSSAAANGATNPAGDQCLYCHDYSIQHGNVGNPLRLRNFAHGTWGKNGVCLVCHATTGATGVQPAANYLNKSANRKVDKYHAGGAHTASLSGGQFCWDCHDAHGDRASATDGRPIAMIQKKPAKASNATTGVPTFFTATTVSFVAKSTGANFVSTAAPYRGVCNVCHDYNNTTGSGKMVHYTATNGDGHESSNVCTSCHAHSNNTTYDGTAYSAPSNCNSCHDYDTVGATYTSNIWSGGYWGKSPRSTPNGYGSHAKHINYIKTKLNISVPLAAANQTYGAAGSDGVKVCGTCHTNALAQHTMDNSSQRLIDFGSSTFVMGGTGGRSLVFGTNPAYSTANRNCSNLSCHYFTTPAW